MKMLSPRPGLVLVSALVAGCGHSRGAAPPTEPACTTGCTPVHLTTLDLVAGQPGGQGLVDGSLSAAHFIDPWSLASDGMGHLYVADGNSIRSVALAAGTVTTLAGGAMLGFADGVGPQAGFNAPSAVVYDAGRLYVTDTENLTIRTIDLASGAVATLAGAVGQRGSTDGALADARFGEPEGLALDAHGHLFVGDTDNNAIRVIDLSSGQVTTLAGMPGVAGTADGTGTAAQFNHPKGLALDPSGTLYVIDAYNQLVRRVAVGTGATPSPAAVSTLIAFQTIPQGLAVDGTDVLVALADSRILRVAPDGTAAPLAGSASTGFVDGIGSAARFNSPAGLWNDGAGTIYVADNGNFALRTIALSGGAVATFAGANSKGTGDGAGTAARFSSPQGLTADATDVYVADTNNSTIRAIAISNGSVDTLAGAAGQSGSVDGPLAAARFNHPGALAIDSPNRRIYVADTSNRSIRQIDLASATVTTPAFLAAPGDNFGGFDSPTGLALDGGRLFVTDYTVNLVFAIDLKTAQVTTLAGTFRVAGGVDGPGPGATFYGPSGIAADGLGNLYVADNQGQTVRKIAIASGQVTTLAGQSMIRGSNDGAGMAAHFSYPYAVAANGAGDIFVSDSGNNVIRHVDASTGAVTTVVGAAGKSGVQLGPLPAQLSSPTALALAPAGLFIVSENSVLLAK
jgi:DNA-binding beta-propeller fold protein YncE